MEKLPTQPALAFGLATMIVFGLSLAGGATAATPAEEASVNAPTSGPCVDIYGPPDPGVVVRPRDCIGDVKDLIWPA